MSVNKGVAPFDPKTPTGKFRVAVGDTAWEELDPVEPGYGDYNDYSDAEIEAFLEMSDGQVEGAVANALFQMALAAAKEALTVKDYDLQVNLEKRATELRLLAKEYQTKADAIAADIFEVFPTVIEERPWPELSARPAWGCNPWQ